MSTQPKQEPESSEGADGSEKEVELSNNIATFKQQDTKQTDAPTMFDNATSAANDNLTQSLMNGSQINPAYGDATDRHLDL